MSIFGATKDARYMRVEEELRVCDDCGYDGPEYNRDVDVCATCKQASPSSGPDDCTHCGDANCMMIACPKCEGMMSLDYEVLEPIWDAKRNFRQFEKRVAALATA